MASSAATRTGIMTGVAPAITALTATFSTVASAQSGGILPTTWSGGSAIPPSIARTRGSVGGTIGRPSVQPRSRKWASTASSESGSSSTSDARANGVTAAAPSRPCRAGPRRGPARPSARPAASRAEPRDELRERGGRLLRDPLGRLAAERVLDDQQREILHPERVGLVVGQGLERGRGDDHRRRARPVQHHRVVDTPRRAGPSVRGAGQHQVEVAEAGEDLGRRRAGGVRLPFVHYVAERPAG